MQSKESNKNLYHVIYESSTDKDETNKSIHQFQIRFFYKPILCEHCRDYIWGEGYIGVGCINCSICVHTKCKIFLASSNCVGKRPDQPVLESITRSNLYPIENWSVDIVKQWLAVVNLHRYAEVFSIYNINGAKLLTLDIYQLYAFRIRDSYHHAAIMQSRDELIFRSRHYSNIQQMVKEQDQIRDHLTKNQYKADHHYFLLHTFSKSTNCDMCTRPLLGIIHQGLLCQKCGIIVHRQCSCNGLPYCSSSTKVIVANKHHLFGVSLFDLITTQQQQSNESNVPFLLIKAFKTIEERAYTNQEDLYDVYRLSADTSKIDQIKQQLNENGIELTDFDNYDLNTIAAIVKSFLRDLQDSVIPEEMYEKLISSIQTSTTEELRSIINNNLDPLHLACLKYVMVHLIKVWQYQFKVIGCHYLPDKLFHIFRSILMRPKWEKIQDIVFNIDKQSLVIQRLVLECDWGIELPEYKIRPKRPLRDPSPDKVMAVQKLQTQQQKVQKSSSLSFSSLSKSASDTQQLPRSASLASSSESLKDLQWFWDDISRDDTILILKNCPDGSFLVRNSTDKNPNAPYTLCVMKGTFVKSIKIFRQELIESSTSKFNSNYLYDIEKPCRFESVQALISYYSRVSLKEYNHNLDLVLTYGASKYKFGKTTEWSIDKLYSSFRDAFNQYDQLTKKCDGLESEIAGIREDLNNKKMACDAFDKIIQMYNDQIQEVDKTLNNNLLKKSSAMSSTRILVSQLMPTSFSTNSSLANTNNNLKDEEIENLDRIMNENKKRLKNRIVELLTKKEEIKSDIEYLNTVVNQLQEELDVLKPELIEVRKKRENYHMWLLQRGENDTKIQTVLKSSDSNSNITNKDNNTLVNDNFDMKQSVSMGNLDKIGQESFKKNDMKLSYESPQKNDNEYVSSLYLNSLNWYKADCTREEANEILNSKQNGTFLVRPSTHPSSKYVISLIYQDQIKHILVDENQNGCFLKSALLHRRLPPHPTQNQSQDQLSSQNSLTKSSSSSSLNSTDKQMNSSTSVSSLSSVTNESTNIDDQSNKMDSTIKYFKTLTELVVFYSSNQIKTAAFSLTDAKLTHPALSERF